MKLAAVVIFNTDNQIILWMIQKGFGMVEAYLAMMAMSSIGGILIGWAMCLIVGMQCREKTTDENS